MTVREEGVWFLATGVAISLPLFVLLGALFGVAMAVMYVESR